jgi:CheY-like chemotaxis protein
MTSTSSYLPVLIVDDDDQIRNTVRRLLERVGCRVAVAAGGTECLDVVRAGFRGLILMDIIMPGLNGWATIRALQEGGLLPGNLICMLTGRVEPGPGNEGLEEYVFDYLVKPFDVTQLVEMVRFASECVVP